MTKIISNVKCPKCGTQFSTIESTGPVSGVEISNGSATFYFQEAEKKTNNRRHMKASEKIAALSAAGVKVDNLFSMANVTGEETIARLQNGQLTIVPEDDPIFAAILSNGTVPNPRLFRRWVTSQMFHMLSYRRGHKSGFLAALQVKGYKYQWLMTIEELRVQARLEANDRENYTARRRWFNRTVVANMCQDYIDKLLSHIGKAKRKKCKGTPYIRFKNCMIFVSDLPAKVYVPLQNLRSDIEQARNTRELYILTQKFYGKIKDLWLDHDIPMATAFKNAYKGAGAYFTMKNLILFHGARLYPTGLPLSQDASIRLLEQKAVLYADEGWRLFGVMKKMLDDNHIDIGKKMEEWRKK